MTSGPTATRESSVSSIAPAATAGSGRPHRPVTPAAAQILPGSRCPGKVISYCTFESLYYQDCPPPWESIVVELEEGPLFLSNPQGFGGEDIEADMPVRVTFLECEDAAGPFKLPVFERA